MAISPSLVEVSDQRKRWPAEGCDAAVRREERQTMDAGRSGGRRRKPLAAGTFQPEISSFRLALAAEAKAAKTVRMYTEAVQWFAAAHLIPQTSRTRWEQVTGQDVQWWMVWLLSRYSESYASNQYRALQQFLITVRGKDGKQRIVKISYPCARTLDRYIRARRTYDRIMSDNP